MYLVQFFGTRVVRLPIAILDRPRRRFAVVVAVRFKILFPQTEKRRAIDLGVSTDMISEARMNLPAIAVEHRLLRVVLERAEVIPVILGARQERAAFKHEDTLAAGR